MKRAFFKYYLEMGLDKPEPIFGLLIKTGYSDVGGEQVLDAGEPLPLFPDYKTWCSEVFAKRRCGRCWRVVRGHDDLVRHVETNHLRAPLHFPAKAVS